MSEASFLKPHRLTDSAWTQHVPFAFWLMEQAKPRLFVELGVHTGMSYFAFCQSVKVNNLATLCYGVDTWKGDEHAGLYSEDIWQDVQNHNAQAYASFSYLLRTTFNEALPYFEDKTIDLLHIDGYHTYEAVKEDFESWLPKMTGTGIVVFHDIVVRERDFGVHRFWTELKQQYKTFEFIHGHGLGVLCLGAAPSPLLHNFFEWNDENEIPKLRKVYAALGMKLTENIGAGAFQTELAQVNAQHQSLQAKYEQLQAEHTLLHQGYEVLRNLAEEVKIDQAGLQAEAQAAAQATADYAALQQQLAAATESNSSLAAALEQLQQEHLQTQQRYEELEKSWQPLQAQHQQVTAEKNQLQEQLARSEEASQQLKTQYEVLKKLAQEAKNNQGASANARQELSKVQAALQKAKEDYKRLQQQNEGAISDLNVQLAEVKRVLSDTQAHASRLNSELARQQQTIQWYKRTYEERSLFGTIKEKLKGR